VVQDGELRSMVLSQLTGFNPNPRQRPEWTEEFCDSSGYFTVNEHSDEPMQSLGVVNMLPTLEAVWDI
jgi:hypothetical protein